jgi:hypothetical protein
MRIEGLASVRQVFRRARDSEFCDPAVYCCSAELEFYQYKQPEVAKKIMDLAMKRFPTSLQVINCYVDIMEAINDELAGREVYMRCLDSLEERNAESEDVLFVLTRFRTFARDRCRDLALVQDIERRIAARKSQSGLSTVIHRYTSYGLQPNFEGLEFDQSSLGYSSLERPGGSSVNLRNNKSRKISISEGENGSHTNTRLEDDMSIPAFLKKLVSILPRKVSGIEKMDIDFVMRNLSRGTLPPPPVRQNVIVGGQEGSGAAEGQEESAETNLAVKRRRTEPTGSDGAPVDAFKQRQKRNRS